MVVLEEVEMRWLVMFVAGILFVVVLGKLGNRAFWDSVEEMGKREVQSLGCCRSGFSLLRILVNF